MWAVTCGWPPTRACRYYPVMTFTILRRADHTTMPWANGSGTTHEVARDGLGADFTWRISFAEVTQPGPFSALPGVDRVITLVEGTALDLDVTDQGETTHRRLIVGEPFEFRGEADVYGTPSGDTIDLNLMTRRGQASGTVVVDQLLGEGLSVDAAHKRTYVAILAGHACIAEEAEVDALDVIEVGDEILTLTGDALIATIRIEA